MTICKVCQEGKDELEYPIMPSGKPGCTCKDCIVARERKKQIDDPDRRRRATLKTLFDMTLKEYDEIINDQNNICAICCDPFNSREGHVDHCHHTLEIRGILCSNCNCGLGDFRDSILALSMALEYLVSRQNGLQRDLGSILQSLNSTRGANGRETGLLHKYGMTLREYATIHSKQNGQCAICSLEDSLLEVDHCHGARKVRGLLCSGCNVGLGHFKDDPIRLQKAIKYLEKGPIKRSFHNVLLAL